MATYMGQISRHFVQNSCRHSLLRNILHPQNTNHIHQSALRYSSTYSAFSKKSKLLRSVTVLTGLSTTGFCVWYAYDCVRQKLLSLRSIAQCHGKGVSVPKPAYYDQFAIDAPRELTVEDASRINLTLYQYAVCPFCSKVRSFLDYYGFPYTIVEVDPIRRKQIKWSEYRKVPVVVCRTTDGKEVQLNDSSLIVSALTTYMVTDNKDVESIVNFYPVIDSGTTSKRGGKNVDYANKLEIMLGKPGRTKREKEEKKWRAWVDSKLIHYLAPNIYRTPREAVQAFDYISTEAGFSGWEQFFIKYLGAGGMYFVAKKLKKKYELPTDVRVALYDAAHEWVKAVGQRTYLGGEEPCLADLNVYGVLSSIEGLDAFNDMLRETKIGPWYYRTKDAVKSHAGAAKEEK